MVKKMRGEFHPEMILLKRDTTAKIETEFLLHIFKVSVESIGGRGRTLVNMFLRAYFNVFEQCSRYNFAALNGVHSLCYWSFGRQ